MVIQIGIAFQIIIHVILSDLFYHEKPPATAEFYVGTYTSGESQGIYKYRFHSNGSISKVGLAAETTNPSFLAKSKDGKFLLAANEIRDGNGNGGRVTSFKILQNKLELMDEKPSAGDSPCFVSINEAGFVLAANYHNGTVGLLKLMSNGYLKGPLDSIQHTGKGTTPRQKGPHAHSAWYVSQNEVITVDLGTNELWFSELDSEKQELTPMNQEKLAMPPGSGPRHLAIHPNGKWIYVINELSSTISVVIRKDQANYELGSTTSTLPSSFSGTNSCAEIKISEDGKFLYASNRGHNSIAIFEINHLNGSLASQGHEATRGDWPRNFTLSPDGNYLLVANQRSNNIVSFLRNNMTGLLSVVDDVNAPNPVHILF